MKAFYTGISALTSFFFLSLTAQAERHQTHFQSVQRMHSLHTGREGNGTTRNRMASTNRDERHGEQINKDLRNLADNITEMTKEMMSPFSEDIDGHRNRLNNARRALDQLNKNAQERAQERAQGNN